MPLPTPSLDDRRFQDLVDQAKRMIPLYCPEWTDHNVSDPGITLIELFAWMTDLLLYRVNQVPDKMYVKFLELIGVRLDPPRAARSPVTFYLSAALPEDVTVPEGTEVATVRTETSPAIIFTTESDLVVRSPVVAGAYTNFANRQTNAAVWVEHDLKQLGLPNRRISLFGPNPAPNDAFYIALEKDHSQHILAVVLDCETAGGAGVDPRNPPTQWQVHTGSADGWAPCEVEYDGTGGFNWSGEVIMHLPPSVAVAQIQNTKAYWLRCQLTSAQAGANSYRVSPDVERLVVEARGATTYARHAVTVVGELLGESDGTPGQTFKLQNRPLLARDPERDYLMVETPDGQMERWQEVEDFGDSGPTDQHYVVDAVEGTVSLGPSLLQPDATVYSFGAVPVRGSRLVFSRYQHGGGVEGNVPKGALSVVKTSIPYIARVANRAPSIGGLDAQSLDDAKLRAPHFLRTRTRAVTADDFEYLATRVPGVSRACCIAPEAQPGDAAAPKPGHVVVVVLPIVDASGWRIPPEQLVVPDELRAATAAYLGERRLLGATLEVQAPQYVWVSVQAKLRAAPRADPGVLASIRQRAEEALYRYLNPIVGGPKETGWPFGRDLYVSEVSGVLQRVPWVEFVDDVQVTVVTQPGAAGGRSVMARLAMPHGGVVCSDEHHVTVARS